MATIKAVLDTRRIRKDNTHHFIITYTPKQENKRFQSVQKIISFFYRIFHLALLGLVLILLIDAYVSHCAKEKSFSSLEAVPYNRVGLVLGTSKYLTNGNQNLYYKYRMEAAEKLFKAGKVKFLLVSGDNGTRYYDEATTMKNDLIARGIPANRIFCDYAGFRTLDSVVRSKEVFQESKITIISQPFHNERALFIAQHKQIDAIAFNAKGVSTHRGGLKTQIRERLARPKMLLDLVFSKQPKFLGDAIYIQ